MDSHNLLCSWFVKVLLCHRETSQFCDMSIRNGCFKFLSAKYVAGSNQHCGLATGKMLFLTNMKSVCVFVCEMSEGGMKKEHPPTHSCQIEQQIRPRLLVWQERFQAQLP